MKTIPYLSLLAASLALAACGGGSSPTTEEPTGGLGTSPKSLELQGTSTTFTINLAAEDSALNGLQLSASLGRSKTDAEQQLESVNLTMSPNNYWQYTQLLPLPDLFCAQPDNTQYSDIVEKLGGIEKSTRIHIATDATTPRVYSNIIYDYSPLYSANERFTDLANSSVAIQRPNIVGQSDDKAFYLSDTYGLLTLSYTPGPVREPVVSCGIPVPGSPKNFVYYDDQLYVMSEDTRNLHSAVLQFDVSGSQPKFINALYIADSDILDARLFNSTLALYLKRYVPIIETETEAEVSTEETESMRVGGDAFGNNWFPNIQYRESVGYELKVITTSPSMSEQYSQMFLDEQEETRDNLEKTDVEQDRAWSSFNPFLSAGGEYLVVTESVRERFFSHYESQTDLYCQDYAITETPYKYCRTKWKRIENPDYNPSLASTGNILCDGDLLSCLKVQAPQASRYIRVPNGRHCEDRVRRSYNCLAWQSNTYDRPRYNYESSTQLHVFRFNEGEFTLLDDVLMEVNGEQLVTSDKPLRISGSIEKHDHIAFMDSVMYAITDKHYQQSLHTLSIQGNSAVYIDELTLNQKRYANLNAIFTENRLYVSQSTWRSPSALQTVSLADRLAPTLSNDISIPTRFTKLMFADNQLLGLGETHIEYNELYHNYMGLFTSFTALGDEQDSLLLGADYYSFRTLLSGDDQVVTLDTNFNRIVMPYSVYHPLMGVEGPYSDHRVSVLNYKNNQVADEATISLPAEPERSLSIDENSVFTFNDQYIHLLSDLSSEWQASELFNGELPREVYFTRNFENQIQKYDRTTSYLLKLMHVVDSQPVSELDRIEVPRSNSSVCFGTRVYFDHDRVLIATEAEGVYISYEDCPTNRDDTQMTLSGYHAGETGFSTMAQADAISLFTQINLDLTCILDSTIVGSGESIVPHEISNADWENAECYSSNYYWDVVVPEARNDQ